MTQKTLFHLNEIKQVRIQKTVKHERWKIQKELKTF